MSSMQHEAQNGSDTNIDVAVRDLNEFKISVLSVLAEKPKSGTDIKSQLETYYTDDITHGQLYPNLDKLDEDGLIVRREKAIDDRTNLYEITSKGTSVLIKRTKWLNANLTGERQ